VQAGSIVICEIGFWDFAQNDMGFANDMGFVEEHAVCKIWGHSPKGCVPIRIIWRRIDYG
jgi:hypothetical protein